MARTAHSLGAVPASLSRLRNPVTNLGSSSRARSYGMGYTGTKLETADTAKPGPTGHCALGLLVKKPHARLERGAWLLGTCFFNKAQ